MSDPTAMEADKTKEEMTMATIIKQTKEEINWAEIARAREKLLRHKGIRKNDQHGGLQKIHLGGGRGVLPGNRSRRD